VVFFLWDWLDDSSFVSETPFFDLFFATKLLWAELPLSSSIICLPLPRLSSEVSELLLFDSLLLALSDLELE
jgi:hypothetical protein